MFNLDKIKSLFVVEDEQSAKAKPSKPSNSQAAKSTPKSVTTKKSAPAAEVKFKADASTEEILSPAEIAKSENKFLNSLLSTLQKNDMEGFDYLEFKTSLRSLKEIQPDEATRYQSAFAIAKGSMGLTEEKLVQSAKFYMSVLVKERDEFLKVVASRVQSTAKGQNTDIETRQTEIKAMKAKIEEMTKAIDTKTKEIEKIKSGVNVKSAKIQRTKQGFTSAFNKSYGVIENDLAKINKYLKPKS